MSVVIKQFGERRTGTNLLRFYISRAWPEVLVLMHVLGDKHSPPVDLAGIWAQTADAPDRLLAFVEVATRARTAETTSTCDRSQTAYLRLRADAIGRAYLENDLKFVISTKHPYSWVASMAKFEVWPAYAWMENIRLACRRYNDNYRAWFGLRASCAGGVVAVPYECLRGNPAATMHYLAAAFGLSKPSTEFPAVSEVVVPTYWDDAPTRAAPAVRFEPSYYEACCFLDELGADSLGLIRNEIEWESLHELGYTPGSGY